MDKDNLPNTDIKEILHEPTRDEIVTAAETDVAARLAEGENDKYGRFFLSALSGIPWILPLSILANFKGEADQEGMNQALALWIRENQDKLKELKKTINEILTRLDSFGPEIQKWIESPEYLKLVSRAFRVWGEADTQEKRKMIKLLLINASAITLCSDDKIRLFIGWIERFDEAHFAVMKEVYQNPLITKMEIWENLNPGKPMPREDSSEAKLFSYLNRELNMGGIVELNRPKDSLGRGIRVRSRPVRSRTNSTLESHFDDTKEWSLSELGMEFVRYVMADVDPLLDKPDGTPRQ